MNSTISFRAAGASVPAPPLVWCAWPISALNTQSYRVLTIIVSLISSLQLTADISAYSLGACLLIMAVAIATATFFGLSTTPAHNGDVFALALVLQHGMFMAMLALLLASVRPRLKHLDLSPFWNVWCHVLFAGRVMLQHFSMSGPVEHLGDTAVVSASCDAVTGLCVNPCKDLPVDWRTFRGSKEALLPIIWDPEGSSWTSSLAGNEWISNATTMHGARYETLLRLLWWSYVLAAPLYQCVRSLANSSPRETRNHIFRRLQQDYRPRLPWESKGRRFYIFTLIWARYLWMALRAVSMDIRILHVTVRGLAWAGKRLYKFFMDDDFNFFGDLVVLENNTTPERRERAKHVAALWYFFALGLYVLFPATVFYITVKSELSIHGWTPEEQRFDEVGQWWAWALAGGVIAVCMIRYLLFWVLPRLLTDDQKIGGKKRIYIADLSAEEDGPEKIALMEKNIADNDLSWPKYLMARALLEWYDFKYWWKDPAEASVEKKAKKSNDPWDWDETWRRGGGRGEINNWTAFPSELPSRQMSSSRELWTAPEPNVTVGHSYDDEAETLKLLHEQGSRRSRRR